ncbi:MAG: NAD(P)/FAD-dependent oxidoreductase [Bacteroidales bacterium]|jgi:predicted Rossmann fold flavoprotein|nr:NAD(P)/FAD-dependent oxidoreductase [Bacteroidales bacterium]MCI2121213.1 NAD(P)/FAD-dependent oxidoreductase [Bacteroidales bacterium]MCI2145997.1 NAD(P)/FAD-dependent oxidoreductase [Bacteroidales bacterium]
MERKLFDIAVIGAGASGLVAAIYAAGEGCSVALLEKNELPGKKLMITGKGRCNITNTRSQREFLLHIHDHRNFFNRAFETMNNYDTVTFFNSIGLSTIVERGERVFPESGKAGDVADALAGEAVKRGVRILYGWNVTSASRTGEEFVISCEDDKAVTSKALVICTGGLSYPATGSTGDGYGFAKGFGHTVTECFPSLTALMPEGYDMELAGISLRNVEIRLYADGDLLQDEVGDMDFTENGLEGPIGIRVSRKAIVALRKGQKVTVVLDLKPALYTSVLDKRIQREVTVAGCDYFKPTSKGITAVLKTLLPMELVKPFESSHGHLTFDNMADALKTWKFTIVSYFGYKRAVVTAGGVSTAEIIPKSMESRLVPGLYFAGELLDIDGDTGGYNLQVAFSTGALAGRSAGRKVKFGR